MSAPLVNCRRVYRNGESVLEPRAPGGEVDSWLEHNSAFHFDSALLVDGVVKHRGYYREDEVPELEARFAGDRRVG